MKKNNENQMNDQNKNDEKVIKDIVKKNVAGNR